jgi:Transposase
MGIIFQTDRRVGITYAYESTSYWDKEKKQPRSHRKLIGRVDEATGDIVPTRGRKRSSPAVSLPSVKESVASKRSFSGATHLFDEIIQEQGILQDLKSCFPYQYDQILSIAYYLILEDQNPLSRFSKWAAIHTHPYRKDIPSQRSSELFAEITEDAKNRFFTLQGKRKKEQEYWFYDSTSISSYSNCLTQVKYGKNKDHEHLEQINLALLYGEQSRLPFYYRKLPGNISDVMTVQNLIADISQLAFKKIKLVMDRGFYSEKNVNDMLKSHFKFIIGVKKSALFVQKAIDKARGEIRNFGHYHPEYDLFTHSEMITWHHKQMRPYKGDTIQEGRRMYLHLFYSPGKALEDERKLHEKLTTWKTELESGKRYQVNEKSYEKYFEVKETPVRGIKIMVKQGEIENAKKNYGYFAMISNDVKDPVKALELYRRKDLIEKAFENIKDRLGFRRMHVSSDRSLDGKMFVEFIALSIMSDMMRRMQDASLFKKYTMTEMLDKIDLIECFEQEGKERWYGEMTEQQYEIYRDLGIDPPT